MLAIWGVSVTCPARRTCSPPFSWHGAITGASARLEWDATKIHGKLFHPRPTTQTLSSDAKREFHHRPGKPGESICLSCFLTVRAVKSQRLEDAEETHRRVCPHRMDIR